MQWDNAYEHEPLVSFVARSACALTELFINNIPISQRELEEVLNLMSGSINFLERPQRGIPLPKPRKYIS